MGRFAADVNDRLRKRLTSDAPAPDWTNERNVAGTSVDVAGNDDGLLVAVDPEWRRADPSDDAAELFRHPSEGAIDADHVVVGQVFTRHYDLEGGGHSSKRLNAEFVGAVAARTLDALPYHPVTVDIGPPTHGGDRPDGWWAAADEAASTVAQLATDAVTSP